MLATLITCGFLAQHEPPPRKDENCAELLEEAKIKRLQEHARKKSKELDQLLEDYLKLREKLHRK